MKNNKFKIRTNFILLHEHYLKFNYDYQVNDYNFKV